MEPCRTRNSRAMQSEEKPLETGSRFQIDIPRLRKKREPVCSNKHNGLACGKLISSHSPPYTRARTSLFSTGSEKSGNTKRKSPLNPNSNAQSDDRLPRRKLYGSALL